MRKFREILHYYLLVRISKAVISCRALAFHQSVKMHISETLKNLTVKIKVCKKHVGYFTYILNIDIDVDIAIFCKCRIDIVSISYRK